MDFILWFVTMDDDDGPTLPSFVPNGDLDEGTSTRVRAPEDVLPHPDGEDADFCFGSRYEPADGDDPTDLGASEMRDAFAQMHALIDRNFSNNTSMTDLVTAVHEFYEERIRKNYDYGEWTKRSIYRYVMQHSSSAEDRQCAEGVKCLWNQVEFLRAHVGVRDDVTGKITPDLRIVKALCDTIKLHSSLVTERRKRPRNVQ